MKLAFSKKLLATVVILGLTACSSGGGGNSNESMTKQNKIKIRLLLQMIQTQNQQIITKLQTIPIVAIQVLEIHHLTRKPVTLMKQLIFL
ncbi:hypothetical protein [Rodentibacter genomosp. 2]|uniref:Uncharacterized protein n=1 Tax=Rodentibacter genomosp. 2 TaxID=1908266 RepID=A0A1V3JIC6_9PAST|nr:hypothetical protein [Rodentibacter genomosp. 2]OOF56383.1 hypothetical protein BKK55_06065 [Rodentibacter genomosp. 2]